MKNLLYKELNLSIHKFFYFLPFLIGLLFFIPQWFFTLVLMYLFWITVPQVYSSYLSNQDNNFIAALPTRKKDIVLSKVIALITLEMIQLVVALIFAIVHNQLYGMWNVGLDANVAFFGVGFMIYGIFNIAFFPYYFKTGYRFGKPTILGTTLTVLFAGVLEYGVIRFDFMRNIFEGELGVQFIVLGVGVLIFVILSYIATKVSQERFEKIDL